MFLDHRTIRKFSTQQVDPQCLNRLITVAQHTATSHFLQSFSIIHITDSALRSQIAAISHQTYVDGNGELLIFVADQYRADLCADHPNQLSSTDKFIKPHRILYWRQKTSSMPLKIKG
nr:nitroreductase family protein [Secundilactobacillus oryzae]